MVGIPQPYGDFKEVGCKSFLGHCQHSLEACKIPCSTQCISFHKASIVSAIPMLCMLFRVLGVIEANIRLHKSFIKGCMSGLGEVERRVDGKLNGG